MKTVLILAPQFVPSSYPPAQRVRLFTNHLESLGWKPIVLSVESQCLEETPDWDFAKLIPANLEVIRAKALPYQWTRRIGIGDLGIRSFYPLLQMARKICKERKIQTLFIPGPPWHTFLIGPLIKREFKIPYILDYIDPWVSSMGQNSRPWEKAYWYRKMAIGLEPLALKYTDHIVAVSRGTNELLKQRYPWISSEKFTAIPYGTEFSDFDFVKKNPYSSEVYKNEGAYFDFVYIGAMLPKAYGVLRALFSAVREIKREGGDRGKKIRLYFIGTTYEADPKKYFVLPIAKEMELEEFVSEFPKRIPYLECNTILTQADAILALGSSEPHYTASKIFPCILADRPLLAIYHEESSVVDVMNQVHAGELVVYSEANPGEAVIGRIKAALLKIINPNYEKPQTDWVLFEKYSARNMTRDLVEVFKKIDATMIKPNENG
ncbi:MAG: hypothetical protein AUJ72_06230 [Candidatus Omnitrophica bacterium CG1_02_46_14]|nr:MAG: hypothetical protein AUJ72_06230 [Candidatus Omnitrophica bacterium CG1_02_46_14]